jgi:hypothetical protein
MEQEQQKWAESVLSSIDGMNRAPMPDSLRDRILGNIPGVRQRIVMLRKPAMWAMAAGLALLIGFNVYSLASYKRKDATTISMQSNPVANEYFAPPPSI